ncbi:tol-pal system protein YbgF [Marinobacter sp. R17]|uniref:tol-pal system protein YbgF n=1 Tax=Marinobacter sp. R17 TaxID=2484250 RepID=UPI000F4D0DBA|nr:tol-pal system protein YbgF [Marinobacter sp. R17]ROT99589.1 tol-pal system protein YbgF [Marinobacter sp. R17]
MRRFLMAAVALSLSGSALAQSSVPAYQNADSAARSQSGDSQASSELYFMIQQLRRQVQELQGDLEEQRHKLDQLSKQSRQRYIDLDQRVLELSRKQSDQPSQAATGASGADEQGSGDSDQVQKTREYRAPTQAEQAEYDEIQTLIRDKKAYDQAIDKLYSFISEHPEGDLTVNAYYWLGEVYLAKPQLPQAKQAFTIVATRFADHRKAPDALYKLGVTQARMGNDADARSTLQSVPKKYPDSNAAKLARDYLTKL